MDDWDGEGEPAAQAEHRPFEFTAFYADLGFKLDGRLRPPRFVGAAVSQRLPTGVVAQTRQMKVTGISKTCIQIRGIQWGQQTLTLTGQRQRPQLSGWGRGFKFLVEPRTPHGVTALVVRCLRRAGRMTELEMNQELRRWSVPARQRMKFRPGEHPQVFAEFPYGKSASCAAPGSTQMFLKLTLLP